MNKKYDLAFTIVELLVVIVVIGILAAITIVSYGGIITRVNASALQSDLTNASKQLKLYQTLYGSYPTALDANNCPTAPTVDSVYCLKPTSGNTFLYSSNNNSSPQTFSLYAVNNSTNAKYRTTNDLIPTAVTPVVATGGAITSLGGYRIHTFTASSTFTVTSGDNVEVLVVGGGGAGGSNNTSSTGTAAGGGGAGGLIYSVYNTVSPGAINVVVGSGGGITDMRGQNSSFGAITATGGGRGASMSYIAQAGGSGGGGSYYYHPLGTGTALQGYSGGENIGVYFGGSGGGGSQRAGYNSPGAGGGAGGGGLYYGNLFGDTLGQNGYFAGGGGGGSSSAAGAGGIGGGGAGGLSANGNNATDNTGGGGGGSNAYSTIGGIGGSGIVIVRYPI
jgi:prepilin-type N-terminal cleavage/methylation domain-containing protein